MLEFAREEGLEEGELILTGFVPEEDLLACYRACKLFIFPSWHEGFGLPALEAMLCGRAVIAANTSSLPEVIGREDALFDPFDTDAIVRKMAQVLSDDNVLPVGDEAVHDVGEAFGGRAGLRRER